MPALAAEERFKAALAHGRASDALAGGAAIGPHRSDLAVVHAEKGIAAEAASTGEQKALLISILLAQAQLQRAVRGEPPLLLLDEVAAHLDAARRAALFEVARRARQPGLDHRHRCRPVRAVARRRPFSRRCSDGTLS